MSTQICVFSDSQLSSIGHWQRSIDAEGFLLRFSSSQTFDKHGGTLTALLREEPVSIQYRMRRAVDMIKFYTEINFVHDWKYVLALPWISGCDELDAAWIAATAYARATSGVVFDPQESKLFDPEEARKVIEEMERTLPEAEKMLRNHVEQLSAKSPEVRAALQTFVQRRSTKPNQA
jgi:hypothetical protein